MEKINMLSVALKNHSILEEDKINKYEKTAEERDQTLYQYLFLNNIYTEQELILMLAKEYNYTYLNLQSYDSSHLPNIINMTWYKEHKSLPIYKKTITKIGPVLYLITSNIDEIDMIIEKTKKLYNVNIVYPILSEETSVIQLFDDIVSHSLIELSEEKKNVENKNEIEKEIKKESPVVYTPEKPVEEVKYTEPEVNRKVSPEMESKENQTLVELLQKTIMDAINSNVSDIHLEPTEESYRIRFRQSDELYESALPPAFISKKMTDKIKSIAKMNVEEVSIPQLGQITIKLFNGKDIDFRVSTFPTKFGEKIVMSIQSPTLTENSLTDLGMEKRQDDILNKVLENDKGNILICGKYRSGKTTTSYNILKKINSTKNNIYAFEKTSTLNIKNITQINISPISKITRKESLEYIDFQDPDMVFIDDVEDFELKTASHLHKNKSRVVLLTLTEKSVFELVNKLFRNFGDFETIFSNFSLLVYQHKLNQNCDFCLTKDTWSKQTLTKIGFSKEDIETYGSSWNTYLSLGCNKCNYKKHLGNVVFFEMLYFDERLKEEIRKSLEQKIDIEDIKSYVLKHIVGNLKNEILNSVKKGKITVLEASSIIEKI